MGRLKGMAKAAAAVVVLAAVAVGGYRLYTDKYSKSVDYYISTAQSLQNEKNYDEAIKECSEGLEKYSDSESLYLIKAEAYYLKNDTEKAAGTLDMGYKMTGSEKIKSKRNEYSPITEKDEAYSPVKANSNVVPFSYETEDNKKYTAESSESFTELKVPDTAVPSIKAEDLPKETETEAESVSQ